MEKLFETIFRPVNIGRNSCRCSKIATSTRINTMRNRVKPPTKPRQTSSGRACGSLEIELSKAPLIKSEAMTKLTKPVARETSKMYGSRNVIVTIAPAGSQSEALIGLRLKGRRVQYVCALSDVYRMAALWHGQKEAAAKRAARKNGVPWNLARKQFLAANSI